MEQEQNPWQITGEKNVYDNKWINVTEYDVINPSGGKGIYGKVHFKNLAVAVVPVDAEGNVYLVGQYRFTIDEYSWEIPEGGCPEGSDPLDTAKRELLEETGLIAGEWTEIMQMHLSNSVTDELAYIYLAKQLLQANAEPEETEQLQVKKLPFNTVYEMVMDGRIKDALTVAAVLKVKLMLDKN
ncbi:NUDIX domain-containing protein [Terrimonas rubra]|uniref:GDP-mannose pyrophosphatase n=1 Tax=Terrimonas rubra TaxID=1035890 RepID=A0ABW6AC62_9BACT